MSNETNQAKLIDHSQRQGMSFSPYGIEFTLTRDTLDQEVVAELAELDMVASELEVATSRVATVERRNVCRVPTSPNASLTSP
jgi:hypothetical protein